jgi:hypothetical protein
VEIQYYAMIDYKGFVDLIDAVGGVYVNVENSFTDYMYPRGNGYQTVSFKAGPQLMDGDTALKYARSRHSLQNGEGSDYARARRQQKVISAFKDALLSSETLLNPTKIMDLLSSVQDNLQISEFDINDIQAGVTLLNNSAEPVVHSFVLDPNIGNGGLVAIADTIGYGIGPVGGLGNYENINEYVQLSLKYPYLYSENPSIYIYNGGYGYQETYDQVKVMREELKYLNIRFMGTKYQDKEGIYVFSNKEGEFTQSVNLLSSYLDTTNVTKPEYITTRLNNEDISILWGKEIIVVEETTPQEEVE